MSKRTSNGGNRVGYGKPPTKHQFKKGTSGNPRGRPPKQERSLIPRQVRNDVLEFSQKPVRVRTRKGEKEMPAVEALLQVLLAKATAGHLPSIRYFFGLYEKAVLEHYETHRDGAYEQLETLERAIQLSPAPVSMSTLDHLNHMRRQTRTLTVRPARGQTGRVCPSDNEEGGNNSG